jgi:predicted RNA-binding protein
MCETNAYFKKNGEEHLYMESVDVLRPEGEKVYLRNLFGEARIFDGHIEEISFGKNRILLKEK